MVAGGLALAYVFEINVMRRRRWHCREVAAIPQMAKVNPAEFVREVRAEIAKVTWPTRKETLVTTGMVFVMVLVFAIFFLVTDQVLAIGMRALLGIGG